jgi:glycosyltransferase involved in cell wall biosynthesis
MDLSIVVPLFNEEDSVRPLVSAIDAVLETLPLSAEIILVDDGCNDRTLERSIALCREYPRLRVIEFRRNYGQTPAMAAGIDQACGTIIVTMDGDLQNDPADIPLFLEKIREGYDVVVGWRHNRRDKLVSRKIPSRIANWIIGRVTGVPIKDNGCSLKAFKAKIIKRVPLYSEMHRFIPAMLSVAAPRLAEIKVNHRAREFGESKYGLSRIYKVLLDLTTIKTIASFTAKPFLWFCLLAAPALILGGVFAVIGGFQAVSTSGSTGVVFTGTGLLLLVSGGFLGLGGAIGELIYKTGDFRVESYPMLTAKRSVTKRANDTLA